jgi:hypothetical protein
MAEPAFQRLPEQELARLTQAYPQTTCLGIAARLEQVGCEVGVLRPQVGQVHTLQRLPHLHHTRIPLQLSAHSSPGTPQVEPVRIRIRFIRLQDQHELSPGSGPIPKTDPGGK